MSPDVGIHYNIPEREYRGWGAANYSFLKRLAISKEQAVYDRDNPQPETPSMLLGKATDCLILSPDLYESLYYEMQQPVDLRTKAGKEAFAMAEIEAAGRVILRTDEWKSAHAMRESVMKHELARELLSESNAQVSIVWQDTDYRVLCKSRIDGIGRHELIDLKTVNPYDIDRFGSHAWKYGYHVQAAMYSDGATALGMKFDQFTFVIVQSAPPYRVKVAHWDDSSLAVGRMVYKRALYEYKECLETGNWTDSRVDQTMSLPDYIVRGEGIEPEGGVL